MIEIFTDSKNTSSRKALTWLKDNGIEYIERDLNEAPLSAKEIKGLLRLSEDGLDEIFSKKCKAYKKMGIDIHDLTLNQAVDLIVENPTMIRKPLIITGKKLVVGYQQEKMRRFLGRKAREDDRRKYHVMLGN